MSLDSTADILFNISADSTEAESNVQKFRAVMGKSFADLKTEFGEWSTKVFGDLHTVGGAMTALTAVGAAGAIALGAAVFEMAKKSAEAGERILEMAERSGLSVQNLSGLRAMTELTGESFDSLGMAMARAGKNLSTAINDPGGKTAKVLAEVMGGAQQLAELGLKPMDDRIQIVLKHIFELNDVGERNAALQALLGRGWMTNIETLKLLAEEGYGPAIDQAKKLGLYFDQEGAQRAKQLVVELKLLEAETKAMALIIGQELIPVVLSAARVTTAWAASILQVGAAQYVWDNYKSKVADAVAWEMQLVGHIPGLKKFGDEAQVGAQKYAEGLPAFQAFTKALKEQGDLLDRLSKGQNKTEGKELLPGLGDKTEYYETFTRLSEMLETARVKAAGFTSEEAKLREEGVKAASEVSKALGELNQKYTDGKITLENYRGEQIAAMQALNLQAVNTQRAIKAIFDAQNEDQRHFTEAMNATLKAQADAQRTAGQALLTDIQRFSEAGLEAKRNDWNREVDARRDTLIKEGNLTAENEQLLKQLRAAGHAQITQEQQQAFAEELQRLELFHSRQIAAVMTAEQRIKAQYAQDVKAFSDAEEKKALILAKDENEREQIRARFARNRQLAYAAEQTQLQTLRNSQGWRGVFTDVFAQNIRGNEALWREWATSANQSLMMVKVAIESVQEMLQRAFVQMANAMGAAIAHAQIYGGSMKQAMKEAAIATLESLSAQAYGQAIYSLALGFLHIAEGDFAGAAAAFEAAAIFGLLGYGAGALGHALVGKQGKNGAAGANGDAGSSGSSAGAAGVPAASSGTAAAQQGPRVTVQVYGHIIGISGAEELAAILNQEMSQRDIPVYSTQPKQLVATTR